MVQSCSRAFVRGVVGVAMKNHEVGPFKKGRLFLLVVKRSGAGAIFLSFIGAYLLCAMLVLVFGPGVSNYGDALWFLWAVSTTVGLGDLTAITPVGRAATIVCSLLAIGTTAIFTGVIVDFFNELRQKQLDTSLTEFLDKLERLPELDKSELEDMARRVRKLRK